MDKNELARLIEARRHYKPTQSEKDAMYLSMVFSEAKRDENDRPDATMTLIENLRTHPNFVENFEKVLAKVWKKGRN